MTTYTVQEFTRWPHTAKPNRTEGSNMWKLFDDDPLDISSTTPEHQPERLAPVLPLFGDMFIDDSLLSWQDRALCAQTDPEAFFPEIFQK